MAACLGPLLAVSALTGCSQTAALAPVGGNQLAEVRFATIDVLLDAGIGIQVAPVCTAAANQDVSCAGTSVDGRALTSTSLASDQDTMTVKAGTTTVYRGSIEDVLNRHSRATS